MDLEMETSFYKKIFLKKLIVANKIFYLYKKSRIHVSIYNIKILQNFNTNLYREEKVQSFHLFLQYYECNKNIYLHLFISFFILIYYPKSTHANKHMKIQVKNQHSY